ncbi:MAG TPA: glycosyltransferase, partial [Planctomycetes bacterium]|nr:glycosyltransferase [Planctomycetota bacterium]
MRLLFVTLGYPPRGRFGTEFYTRELAQGLLARGHEIHVLHPVRDGHAPRYTLESVREEGVSVHLLHNPGDPSKRFEPSWHDERVERVFDGLVERLRPDRVHFTYLLWGLSVGLVERARAAGVPALVTLTDYGLLCHRGQMFRGDLTRCDGPRPAAECARCIRAPGPFDLAPLPRRLKALAAEALAAVGGARRVVVPADLERRERAVRAALAAADRLIAPTAALARRFVRAGVPEHELTTLPYAFEEAPYRAVRDIAPPDPPRFGFLGQFAPHKGLATLLEAERILRARAPERPFEVVLHGGAPGGRGARFVSQVLAPALAEPGTRVRVGEPFGPDEAPRLLAGFSAICLPSEWDENAPLSVLQARAIGVPVLGTNVPGIAEALPAEEAERLVDPGDAAGLADRMEAVLSGEIGRSAHPGLAVSLEQHLDKIEALYDATRFPSG